jgi:NTP pyrophosphatase (non-canonical NTP hydrolase)
MTSEERKRIMVFGCSNLTDLKNVVHDLARAKGWYDGVNKNNTEDQFIERACNNLHDEVSELHEAWRNNRLREPCDKAEGMIAAGLTVLTCIEEEFADVIIRVLDYCAFLGIDIQSAVAIKHMFNETRPARHGEKRS